MQEMKDVVSRRLDAWLLAVDMVNVFC
jgi:hypothetical protein